MCWMDMVAAWSSRFSRSVEETLYFGRFSQINKASTGRTSGRLTNNTNRVDMEKQEFKSKWDELAREIGAEIPPETIQREEAVAAPQPPPAARPARPSEKSAEARAAAAEESSRSIGTIWPANWVCRPRRPRRSQRRRPPNSRPLRGLKPRRPEVRRAGGTARTAAPRAAATRSAAIAEAAIGRRASSKNAIRDRNRAATSAINATIARNDARRAMLMRDVAAEPEVKPRKASQGTGARRATARTAGPAGAGSGRTAQARGREFVAQDLWLTRRSKRRSSRMRRHAPDSAEPADIRDEPRDAGSGFAEAPAGNDQARMSAATSSRMATDPPLRLTMATHRIASGAGLDAVAGAVADAGRILRRRKVDRRSRATVKGRVVITRGHDRRSASSEPSASRASKISRMMNSMTNLLPMIELGDLGDDADDGDEAAVGDGATRSRSVLQRAIPSWDEAIGFIVDTNLQSRSQRRPPPRSGRAIVEAAAGRAGDASRSDFERPRLGWNSRSASSNRAQTSFRVWIMSSIPAAMRRRPWLLFCVASR